MGAEEVVNKKLLIIDNYCQFYRLILVNIVEYYSILANLGQYYPGKNFTIGINVKFNGTVSFLLLTAGVIYNKNNWLIRRFLNWNNKKIPTKLLPLKLSKNYWKITIKFFITHCNRTLVGNLL